MAIGRTFPESLQKAIRSLEQGRAGLNADPAEIGLRPPRRRRARGPGVRTDARSASSSSRRPCAGASRPTRWPRPPASTRGSWTSWRSSARARTRLEAMGAAGLGPDAARPTDVAGGQAPRVLRRSDRVPAVGRRRGRGRAEGTARGDRGRGPRRARSRPGCGPPSRPSTPAAPSSQARTPYHYATYEDEDEVRPAERPRVVILGSGPNRIGQGIEFDYCCVHASMALQRGGLRDGDGQLQPRDGLHRLRHLGPPLLRAHHRRGRRQRPRRRDRARARARGVRRWRG